MKVVVTSEGQGLDSKLDRRFGRAKWLVLVDTDTGGFSSHDNTVHLNAPSGAGIQTAGNVAELGADAVVTSNLGPNAFKTLAAAKVKVYLSNAETVQEALDLLKAGELEEMTAPNVEGHWL